MATCKSCNHLIRNPKTGRTYCVGYIDQWEHYEECRGMMPEDPLNKSWVDYGRREESSPRRCPTEFCSFKKRGWIDRIGYKMAQQIFQ